MVQAISQGRPGDSSTQRAQTILEVAKQDPLMGEQIASSTKNQLPTVYIQITKDEQRADVNELVGNLQGLGFDVPDVELVNPGTQNTYVRHFSERNQQYGDQVFQVMKKMGFDVQQQDFSKTPIRDKTPPGVLELWIGHKQGPLPKQSAAP